MGGATIRCCRCILILKNNHATEMKESLEIRGRYMMTGKVTGSKINPTGDIFAIVFTFCAVRPVL